MTYIFSEILHFLAKLITSSLGIGFLPAWQNHWAAFCGAILSIIIILTSVGFSTHIENIASLLLLAAIILIPIAMLSIKSYRKNTPCDNEFEQSEAIVIHITIAQMIILALTSMPIYYFFISFSSLTQYMCKHFLVCHLAFKYFLTFAPSLGIPYSIYRFFDTIKPWPASYLDIYHHNALGKFAEATCNVIYSSVIVYLIAMIFFGLPLAKSLSFFKIIIHNVVTISIL